MLEMLEMLAFQFRDGEVEVMEGMVLDVFQLFAQIHSDSMRNLE